MFGIISKKVKGLQILIISVIILAVCHSGCSHKKVKNEISDEIVLKCGPAEITRYEFERNKAREYQPERGLTYNEWLNGFIEETYLLADALSKKYDTISVINKQVNYAAYAMVGQAEGYLWQKTVTPRLKFSDRELKNVYKKRDKIFYLEYLQFPDENTITKLLDGGTTVKTGEDFDSLVKKCSTDNSVIYRNQPFLFPFSGLDSFKKSLYNLKQGEIKKLSSADKEIFLFHLIKIESREQKPFKTERDNIESLLKQALEIQIIEEKQNEVFSKAKITINEKVEADVLEILKKAGTDRTFDIIPAIADDTLMIYRFNGRKKYMPVSLFLDFYTNDFTLFVIDNKEHIEQTLKNYVIDRYLYVEAENLGVTKEKKYLLDKKNFKNKLILQSYQKKEFDSLIHISDRDLQEYYRQNEQFFSEPVLCHVAFFTFKDQNSLYRNFEKMKSDMANAGFESLSDTIGLVGLIAYEPDVLIKKDTKKYPAELVERIFQIPVNKLSLPFNPAYSNILFVKTGQGGKRVKTFEEVKSQIEQTIHYEKVELMKKERVNDLKGKYLISIKKI